MKIYVGCGLTHAPEAFKEFVIQFKRDLTKEAGCEISEFLGLVNGTATDVYKSDLGYVEACQKMIAFVDEPSIGLGMEISTAISLKKPLLCLAREGVTVTRMLRGADELGLLSLKYYRDLNDAVGLSAAFLENPA